MQKPDGLVVLDDEDIPQMLLALDLKDICGIGSQMDHRLRAHGIDSMGKLYAATKAELRGIWGGVEGERMFGRLRGEVIPLLHQEHKTVGHSHVLPPALRTEAKSLAVLHRLLQKAAMRLRAIGHYAGGHTQPDLRQRHGVPRRGVRGDGQRADAHRLHADSNAGIGGD